MNQIYTDHLIHFLFETEASIVFESLWPIAEPATVDLNAALQDGLSKEIAELKYLHYPK